MGRYLSEVPRVGFLKRIIAATIGLYSIKKKLKIKSLGGGVYDSSLHQPPCTSLSAQVFFSASFCKERRSYSMNLPRKGLQKENLRIQRTLYLFTNSFKTGPFYRGGWDCHKVLSISPNM